MCARAAILTGSVCDTPVTGMDLCRTILEAAGVKEGADPGAKAILARSNLDALGVIRALTEEKRRIPDDVAIISFDDMPHSSCLATPLATVAQANSEMGEVAVKLLFDQIQFPHRQTKGGSLLPAALIMRESVKRLRAPSN